MRTLTYVEALNEALHQMMEDDGRVFLIGQGLTSPWYVGQSCLGLIERFGEERVIDTPVSENATTGAAIGAAIAGMRPIVVHPRLDFMYYAMDPIINQAANWYYMYGSQLSVPVVIWGIINRGGEQGAQHAQSIQSMFAHAPGLKVIMPSTPYDVKGMLMAAVKDGNPVLFVDDRWLYQIEGEVPEERYTVPIGKAKVRRKGSDLTIVSTSYLVHESLKAAEELSAKGVEAEVIDLLTIKPLDSDAVIRSVSKTGKLLVVDGGWKSYGVSGEVMARVAESEVVCKLRAPMSRITLPDAPAPASRVIEDIYFKKAKDILAEAYRLAGV
jgi:acetoin:2,6-dichlorophenolindophenol oxidoreductase subunit beta